MKIIGGALVLLAGAVLYAAGAVADAIVEAAGHGASDMAANTAKTAGVILGLLGLVVFSLGLGTTLFQVGEKKQPEEAQK